MHKILIVDDEPEILETLEDLIEHKLSGCEIDKANNGLDAFILCQTNQYDLIITDHKMPFMTGAAFIIALKTRKNKCKDCPIIVLSAHIDEDLRKKLTLQNVGYMEKPFTPDHLIDIIRTRLI